MDQPPQRGSTREGEGESGSDEEIDRSKILKRASGLAEALEAFKYRSPGNRTLQDCSLTAIVTPDRINMEVVQCARTGDAETMEAILIALGKNLDKFVNALDEQKLSPLHYAAQYNHPSVIRVLLKFKADVNIAGDENATPAHYSAMPTRGKKASPQRALAKDKDQMWSGSSCVPLLKANGADYNRKDIYGQTPLHYAAIHGNVVAASDILKFRTRELLEAEDNQQMRALHAAALYNEVDVAKLLIDAGAELLCDDHEKSSPLHHACAYGNIEFVRKLFDATAKLGDINKMNSMMVEAQDVEGSTCLHLAVEYGHSEVASLCIQKGANVNKPREDGMFPLHLAVISGKTDVARLLLDQKAKVDAANNSQETPLHKAAQYNRVKVAKLLLRRGANIESRDRDNDTPLLIAAIYGNMEILAMLIKKGADITATNLKEKSAVYAAAEEGNLSVLQVLFQSSHPQDLVNWGDRNGNTPLHIAAQKKNLQIVKILLQNRAYVHSKNELEECPIHWAAKHGNAHAIREIAKKEPNAVFAEDEKSSTPLHFAALFGHAQSVSVLIDLGADVAQKNCSQWTALDMAAYMGWKDTCTVLLKADSPVDPTDKRDTTPLHLACSKGHGQVVDLLLQWNASVTKKDRDGMNCLDLAIENNNSDVARQIIQSDKWKDALRHAHFRIKRRDVIIDTPLRRLIKKMPEIAKEVFDRCITTGEEKDPTSEDYDQNYNYEFIDDLYADWAQPKKEAKNNYKTNRSSFNRKSNHPRPYSTRAKTIKENHPLTIMVSANQEHLLAHPLVTSLISHKWWSFGAWYYLCTLVLHIFFIAFLTSFSLNALAPHKIELHDRSYTGTDIDVQTKRLKGENQKPNKGSLAEAEAIKSGSCNNISSALHQKDGVRNDKYVLIFLVTVCIVNELFQIYQSKSAYLTINNITEWTTYIFTILVVIDFNDCQTLTGFRYDWQWSLAALAVFLSWTDLMLFIQGFSSLGIYVVMFRDILVTFLKAITVFFVLILAFAMSFSILLQNQIPFRDVGNSLMKTFVMIIGEYDFNDIFNAGVQSTAPQDKVFYPEATYILFASFVILSSIVLMNLLVGLAVDDIKGILRQAALKRMAMQVELTLDVEKILPDFIRRKFYLQTKKVKPNHISNHRPQWLLGRLIDWWKTDPAEDEDAVLREIPKIRKTQEKIQKDIKHINRVVKTVHDMHVQNKRIESMLQALLRSSDNISWMEEDYTSGDEQNSITPEMVEL